MRVVYLNPFSQEVSGPDESLRALLGAPIDIGASQRGTLMGPAALRTAGLLTLLDGMGFEVMDHGDLSIGDVADLADVPPDNARHYREIQRWTRALSTHAYELARSGVIPIFLGGDHTLSMGSVNGIARHCRAIGRELFVVWLDAHADYNTPATTVSGNMHGMSAAFLCGEPGLDGLLGEEPRSPIDPDQLELFGIRSIDKLERDLLRARRISIADMRQIDEFGVAVLIRRVIDKVRARKGVLHVSFDVDFLDADIAPGVGTTVKGGPTYREAQLCMEMIADTGALASLDVMELNPALDVRNRTAEIAVDLIESLFGKSTLMRR